MGVGLFSWLASTEKGEKKPHPPGAFREKPLYTVFRVGRVTFFPAYLIELNTKNSARWQLGVQLGLRQTQALIKTKTIRRGKLPPAILQLSSNLLLNSNIAGGNFPLLIVRVLISACGCRRPS